MRRLIINADDFGLTQGVNRAILQANENGIVTSTTLMANARAFQDAVTLARRRPHLSIGCHVVLTDGTPLLPPQQLPNLTAGRDGEHVRFRHRLSGFATRALAGRIRPEEIGAEATAQIQKIQSTGISLTHFDTHKHTHIFPAVLAPLLRAAAACGIRAVRNPFSPVRPLPASMLRSRPGLWKRYAQMRLLRRFAGEFLPAVHQAGLLTTDGTLGVLVTGTLDEGLFRAIIQSLPEGTWEFVCHPGRNDADLRAAGTRLRQSREQELQILTSPDMKLLLAHHDIELISYGDLSSSGP